MENTLTAVQAEIALYAGSLDDATAVEQMWAVDHALQAYFDAENWLKERDDLIPSLRRK